MSTSVEQRPGSRSETRGFLFADVRGYTQFIERQGAAAAADLLLRYRAVVREAITRHEGAEIRTEGDSFYVVLRSASDAVLCGMAIVQGVAEENARAPSVPIRVGVGVHAGEAIDTAEGLVGSAVNVAARVCALAGPGDVLVTDTVRGLTRSVIPVGFASRGRQRLKGVAEPIELFSVTAAAAGPRRRRLGTRRAWLAAATSVVVVGAIAGFAYAAFILGQGHSAQTGLSPTFAGPPPREPSASIASGGSVQPSAIASAGAGSGPTLLNWGPAGQAPYHLRPGEYEFGAFRPAIAFALDATKSLGADWWFTCGHPDFVTISAWDTGKIFPGVGEFDLPDNASPCYWQGVGKPEVDILRVGSVGGGDCTDSALIRTPQDLFEWLSKIPILDTAEPQQVIVAGRPALSIETTITGDVGMYCHGATGDVPFDILRTSVEGIAINPGDRAQFIVLDVGEALPLLIHAEAPTDVWSTAQTRLLPVLDSMTIAAP
jgi:class 3 adenylate cyclase